jgi:hypothetical protein
MAYHRTAQGLAALGRNGDSMLMHVNPQEIEGLSAILGSPTTNPKTGLPEAFNWTQALAGMAIGTTSLGTGAAVGGVTEDAIKAAMGADTFMGVDPETWASLGGTAASIGGGAALGAGIGGITGGGPGALGGAIQGAGTGLLGGMESKNILGPDVAEKPSLQTDTSMPQYMDDTKLATEEPDYLGKIWDNYGKYGKALTSMQGLKRLKEYASPALQMGMAGYGVTEAVNQLDAQNRSFKQRQAEDAERQRLKDEEQAQLLASIRGLADGGPVSLGTEVYGVPVTSHIPERYMEELKRSGGIAGVANEVKQQAAGGIQGLMQGAMGKAAGGFINTQPINPQNFHPQSEIPGAQPYPAATPQKHEMVQGYGEGGFLDGPGDGMSDDLDANIYGREPVKLADGEYVVPKDIVDMLGVDKLDQLLKSVRVAAHGKEDQIKQDAGKLAAERMIDRAMRRQA